MTQLENPAPLVVRHNDIASFERAVKFALAGRALLVDLEAGLHEPHQAASQLARQLGARLPVFDAPKLTTASHRTEQLIGRLVDQETLGYRPAQLARSAADCISNKLMDADHGLIIILAPALRCDWGDDNLFFLHRLAQKCHGRMRVEGHVTSEASMEWLTHIRIDVSDTAPELPETSIHRRRMEPSFGFVSRATPDSIRLPGGCGWIPPSARSSGLSRADSSDRAILDEWQQAKLHTLFPTAGAMPKLLGLAYKAIELGSYEVGIPLLDAAASCVTGASHWELRLLADGMRIGLEKFDEIDKCAVAPDSLGAQLRSQFLQQRGWACVMTGEPQNGDVLLREALALRDGGRADAEYLYLRNIYALCRFRQGDLDGALVIEREIESALSAQERPNPHLTYLNAMNLGRLLLQADLWKDAGAQFERAFSTNDGLRTLGDHLMRYFYLARIAQARGDVAEAFRRRVQAALIWLSSDERDALPARVARLICGKNTPKNRLEWESSVSATMLHELADGAVPRLENTWSPRFVGPGGLGHASWKIWESPWGVLAASSGATGAEMQLETQRLGAFVWRLLRHAGVPFRDTIATILVDDSHGRGIACGAEAVRALNDRIQFGLTNFDASSEDVTVSILRSIDAQSKGETVRVRYLRYRTGTDFAGAEAELLKAAIASSEPLSLAALSAGCGLSLNESRAAFRSLEEQRVVCRGNSSIA